MDELRDKKNKRIHCVSVRLNDEELVWLDSVRRKFRRGTALRLLARCTFPPEIPAINRELHAVIARGFGNIAALGAASRKGGFVPEVELLPLMRRVQSLLIGAERQLDEGDES